MRFNYAIRFSRGYSLSIPGGNHDTNQIYWLCCDARCKALAEGASHYYDNIDCAAGGMRRVFGESRGHRAAERRKVEMIVIYPFATDAEEAVSHDQTQSLRDRR